MTLRRYYALSALAFTEFIRGRSGMVFDGLSTTLNFTSVGVVAWLSGPGDDGACGNGSAGRFDRSAGVPCGTEGNASKMSPSKSGDAMVEVALSETHDGGRGGEPVSCTRELLRRGGTV